MKFIEQKILQYIFGKRVLQSPSHRGNIIELYSMIRKAAEDEFVEDSSLSLKAFLQECFEESFPVH